jgi:hypothetical protein
MIFLGKLALANGERYLSVLPDGKLAMRNLSPNDSAIIFVAYKVSEDRFSLQASNGNWIQLSASQSPNAWYPVLYAATTGPHATRFALEFFDVRSQRVKLAWTDDDGSRVALYVDNSLNPYCQCEFDSAAGWAFGLWIYAYGLTPGIPVLEQTGSGVGADFSSVDLSGADLSNVNFERSNFSGARMSQTRLRGANLAGAIFTGAHLDGTDFTDAVLTGTDFSGADVEQAIFGPTPGSRPAPDGPGEQH